MTDILLEEHNIDHPLKNKNMGKLLHLEDLFGKKVLDVDILNDLCLMYAKLVEYYDLKRDPIKLYFLEKIQVVTSCKSTITLLGKTSKDLHSSPPQIDPKEEDVERLLIKKAMKELSGGKGKIKTEYDYQSRRQVRAKNFDFTLKLDNEHKKTRKSPIESVVLGMDETRKLNDSAIKDNLKSQTDLIKAKLEKRKQNSFQRSIAKNQSMRELKGPMFSSGPRRKNQSIGGLDEDKILGDEFLKEIKEARTPRDKINESDEKEEDLE